MWLMLYFHQIKQLGKNSSLEAFHTVQGSSVSSVRVCKVYFYLLQMHVCTVCDRVCAHVCVGGYMCILEC